MDMDIEHAEDGDAKALEDAVIWSRSKPLTEDELKAFVKAGKAPGEPRVVPYVKVIECGRKGKKRPDIVPILGVKVSF